MSWNLKKDLSMFASGQHEQVTSTKKWFLKTQGISKNLLLDKTKDTKKDYLQKSQGNKIKIF